MSPATKGCENLSCFFFVCRLDLYVLKMNYLVRLCRIPFERSTMGSKFIAGNVWLFSREIETDTMRVRCNGIIDNLFICGFVAVQIFIDVSFY